MGEPPSHPPELVLGDRIIRPGTSRLVRGSEQQVLDPKELAVLLLLADRAPGAVSTDELLDHVWPGVVVGDNVVHQVITRLRRALGDDARRPRYIETLRKRGYRLLVIPAALPKSSTADPAPRRPRRWQWHAAIATVMLAAVGAVAVLEFGSPVRRTPAQTVAVVPFRDLTPEGDLDWLAYGLTFELSYLIGQIGGYELVSGPEGAGEPPRNVDIVLEGHVQRSPEGVVLGVMATDPRAGRQLWAESFSGERDDPYDLQMQMASRLYRYFRQTQESWAADVPTVITGPRKPEAREAYFRLLHHQWGGDPRQLLAWAERTVEIDPSWGAGHLHLANEYIARIGGDDGEHWASKAREALAAARRAGLEKDPYFLLTEGAQLWRLDGNLPAAEERLRQAALAASHGYGIEYAHLMVASGLAREAEPLIAKLTSLVPHFPVFWYHLAIARAINGDSSGALAAAKRWGDLTAPHTYTVLQFPLVLLTARIGSPESARQHLERLDALSRGQDRAVVVAALLRDTIRFELAMRAGDTGVALSIAERVAGTPRAAALVGSWFLRLDDPRAAHQLALASQTTDRGFLSQILMATPAPFRRHPAFRTFLDALGHTREWQRELCRRAATLPAETGLACDPARYAPASE